MPSISPVGPRDADRATAVLLLAFADDPFARWLYPSAHTYVHKFPDMIRAFAQQGYEASTVRMLDSGAGAAVWLPPNLHPDDDALGQIVANDLPENIRDDAASVFEAMDEHHPSEPHCYLPLIGVDPSARGRGHGASLLVEALDRCDREAIAVYLDSTNPRNIPLYQRHGFELLGTIETGTAPSVSPMLRTAR